MTEETEEEDPQVGIVESFSDYLKALVTDTDYFKNEKSVFRLGVAVALVKEMEVKENFRKQRTPTKWRVYDTARGSSGKGERLEDLEGNLEALITALSTEKPDDEWYKEAQYLASLGIKYLHDEIIVKDKTLHDALEGCLTKEKDS